MSQLTMRLRHVLAPALLTIGIGLGFTAWTAILVWGQPHIFAPLSVLAVCCFIMTGMQCLLPLPDCELSALCGPRHVFFMFVGVGLLWLAEKCGVHFSVFSHIISEHAEGRDVWSGLGMCAGWACATFWPTMYILVHGVHPSNSW